MNKETYQDGLDNLYAKNEELQKGKETFKANITQIFSDFRKDSLDYHCNQLKENIILIFNDYIVNAETKLTQSKEEVNEALKKMKEEIDQKLKEADESYKLKQENLKTKIHNQKQKIIENIEKNNLILKGTKLENHITKDKEIDAKDIVGSSAGAVSALGLGTGIILGIVESVGFAACLQGATVAGFTFGGIGAIAGAFVGLAGFGAHKAWKYFHKKEDLIKAVEQSKNYFTIQHDKFYKNLQNLLDEDKKNIIDSFCNLIDDQITKMENIIKEMERQKNLVVG